MLENVSIMKLLN